MPVPMSKPPMQETMIKNELKYMLNFTEQYFRTRESTASKTGNHTGLELLMLNILKCEIMTE